MSHLAEDMARWEAGDLPLTEVEARHPVAGVRELADLHAQLAALPEEDPILEMAGVWMEIRGRLHSPPSPLRTALRWRAARPLVAAAAAVLLLSGIAYAAGVEPVREGVDRVVRVVKGFFDDDRKAVHAPGDSGPTRQRRDERSGPGGGEDAQESADDDRSGPGGGGDDPQDNDDEDRSGSGDGDDRQDEPEGAEHEGHDDDSSSDSSSSGSGSDDDPDDGADEKSEGAEGSDEADD